jgi:hypothetical protein
MYLDYSDMFLIAWCFIMTLLWVKTREQLKHMRFMISNTLRGIAEGKLKVINHGDHCEIKETSNAR